MRKFRGRWCNTQSSATIFLSVLLLIPQFCPHRPRLGLLSKTGQLLVQNSSKQLLSANLRRSIGSPTTRSVQNRDSPFSGDILPFSVVSWGKVAQSSWLSRFSSRFSVNLRKASAPIVRLRAVRAHAVMMGPDMHWCRSSWPIRNVSASLLHSRSLPMRTKLGDQQ